MTPRRRPAALPQRVVGIGASAGGLEALRQLIARIPVDTGLAVVVLQHLPPSQTGQLANLLAKNTALPVINAESGRRIESNTILIVPPHTCAVMFRGALVLRKAKPGKRPYLPIDQLFTSLARVLDERAVGVVLSGTARDGTEGLRAIQAAGGLTFAQDPTTAQFDDMPRNAIAAGVAEVVLAPPEIGEELGVIAKLAPRPATATAAKAPAPGLERILDQLREASGIDFTSYKRSTIERRLSRRLAKLRLDSLEDYSAYLTEHASEAREVYEDLLIHVTEFFRDRDVLDKLITHVTTDILRDRAVDEPIRVWVPGCSTGEEVYSLAILLLERLGDRRIQLFGSDLSEKAIEAARIGRYPASIASQVGATRLERFFNREDGGYRINRDVRERCVFVRHDLVTDPPFSKLDLVSCRNVLIYLGPPLQKRVIPMFHYALNQPGYLQLGRAEAITGFESLFSTLDGEARIYCRKPAARTALTFPIAGQLGRQPWRRPTEVRSTIDIQRDVDHVLLARYAPACVLVDENLDVVQFRGRTGAFLEPPPGQPQQNLLRMARNGLAGELPLALQRAQRSDSPVRRENVVVRDGNRDRRIHLEVVPVRGSADGKRHFLVVFEDAATKPEPVRRTTKGRREPGEMVRLRQELAATKEYLHSVVTQHLSTSEDLGITNEELQSANEELQSSNEELQTAKEELVSTNEELETVNEELQHGNQLLHEANDDLVNVLASVEIGIIIVDTERRVRRFTPKARLVMKLIAGDVGRPIDDLKPRLVVPDLDATIATVIETLEVHESEVRHPDGTWYRLQIRPYRTADGKTSGAVIAFVDITALRIAREYPAAIVETVPTPLVVIDDRLNVRSANAAFYALFAVAIADVSGSKLLDLGKWRSANLHARLIDLITNGTGFDDFEVEHNDKAGDRVLRLGARPIPSADGAALFLVAMADVTELKRLERVRELAQKERDSFLDAVSHELRTPLNAIILWAQALRGFEQDDPRREQGIDTILDSARTEAQLIDDLLELALSRTTELTVKVESIDPASVIRSAVDAARSLATAKHIAIETTLEPGPHIDADPRRLKHIASNLISNAIKFTPDGGQVSVSLGLADGEIELRVRDSGPGIAPEFLPHVFTPFSQADRSSTREHAGLGIGLALVRHFVERQGGTIDVVSPGNGKGTTFTVHLPAARSPTSV